MAWRGFTGASMELAGGGSNPSRSVEVLRKKFPESGACSEEKAFYRTHRHPKDNGDFLVGKLLVAPQNHGGALIFRKGLERGIDGLVEFAFNEGHIWMQRGGTGRAFQSGVPLLRGASMETVG